MDFPDLQAERFLHNDMVSGLYGCQDNRSMQMIGSCHDNDSGSRKFLYCVLKQAWVRGF
jgi:hypothetical protein